MIAPLYATCQTCRQRFPYTQGMSHTCAKPAKGASVAGKATLSPAKVESSLRVRRPKAGSDTEAMLAAQLSAAGRWDTTERENDGMRWQDCFRRQHPWGLALVPERGFTADIAFLRDRLLCEIKGLAHAAGRKKVKADVEREGLAVSLGWRVLPLTPESVRDGSAVALIARALNTNAARAAGEG